MLLGFDATYQSTRGFAVTILVMCLGLRAAYQHALLRLAAKSVVSDDEFHALGLIRFARPDYKHYAAPVPHHHSDLKIPIAHYSYMPPSRASPDLITSLMTPEERGTGAFVESRK
ncbi:hypothetical protein LIA77_05052 [Sarocladium implicatum]|nr:hypothetical protein LIA77_05052 [Sarocladium implicatum]